MGGVTRHHTIFFLCCQQRCGVGGAPKRLRQSTNSFFLSLPSQFGTTPSLWWTRQSSRQGERPDCNLSLSFFQHHHRFFFCRHHSFSHTAQTTLLHAQEREQKSIPRHFTRCRTSPGSTCIGEVCSAADAERRELEIAARSCNLFVCRCDNRLTRRGRPPVFLFSFSSSVFVRFAGAEGFALIPFACLNPSYSFLSLLKFCGKRTYCWQQFSITATAAAAAASKHGNPTLLQGQL
jgi:hypothetical protein